MNRTIQKDMSRTKMTEFIKSNDLSSIVDTVQSDLMRTNYNNYRVYQHKQIKNVMAGFKQKMIKNFTGNISLSAETTN